MIIFKFCIAICNGVACIMNARCYSYIILSAQIHFPECYTSILFLHTATHTHAHMRTHARTHETLDNFTICLWFRGKTEVNTTSTKNPWTWERWAWCSSHLRATCHSNEAHRDELTPHITTRCIHKNTGQKTCTHTLRTWYYPESSPWRFTTLPISFQLHSKCNLIKIFIM